MTANVALKDLPEWNLADLYASPDAASFKTDMEKSVSDAAKFAMSYGGKLATLSGAELAKAISDYEQISEVLGRTGSYAQLYYVGDTTKSDRAKFYGDVNNKITEISTQLLFFELELNQIDEEKLRQLFRSTLAEKPAEHLFRNNYQPQRVMTAIGG